MKLEITEQCTGHGRCYVRVPSLVVDDEDGFGVVRGDGDVPADLVEDAELAVFVCPERAIRLVE